MVANTERIFDAIAPAYLRDDSHWGSDLDLIKYVADKKLERQCKIKIVDLGCGPGWHLLNVATIYRMEIKRIVGVDFSEKMLEEAKKSFERSGYNIELRKVDVRQTEFDNREFDIGLLLNNVLGNVSGYDIVRAAEERECVLREAHRILTDEGLLVFSVYNKERLDLTHYGKNRVIDGTSDFSKGDLVVNYRLNNREIIYHSHWFTEKEVHELFGSCGFIPEILERRMSRYVGVVRKRQT